MLKDSGNTFGTEPKHQNIYSGEFIFRFDWTLDYLQRWQTSSLCSSQDQYWMISSRWELQVEIILLHQNRWLETERRWKCCSVIGRCGFLAVLRPAEVNTWLTLWLGRRPLRKLCTGAGIRRIKPDRSCDPAHHTTRYCAAFMWLYAGGWWLGATTSVQLEDLFSSWRREKSFTSHSDTQNIYCVSSDLFHLFLKWPEPAILHGKSEPHPSATRTAVLSLNKHTLWL